MARENIQRVNMNSAEARAEYVGALIADESRLMLVSVDPNEPWEAFRALRRLMRKSNTAPAEIALFESATPIEHQADVISLESRRRAG